MGKYFIGKGVQLLTEETENKIRIYKLGLLQPEFGHMPCISGNAFTFLLAEEGEIQCQINQEKVDLEAGEALFIKAETIRRLCKTDHPYPQSSHEHGKGFSHRRCNLCRWADYNKFCKIQRIRPGYGRYLVFCYPGFHQCYSYWI